MDVGALVSASPRTRAIEPAILPAYLASAAGSAYVAFVKPRQSRPRDMPARRACGTAPRYRAHGLATTRYRGWDDPLRVNEGAGAVKPPSVRDNIL